MKRIHDGITPGCALESTGKLLKNPNSQAPISEQVNQNFLELYIYIPGDSVMQFWLSARKKISEESYKKLSFRV